MSDATNFRLLRSRRDEVRERYHANPRLLHHLVQVGVGERAVEALRGPDAAAPVKRSVVPQFELAEGRIYPMPTGSPAYAREAVLATSESDEDHAEVRRCYEAKNAIQEAGMPLLETLVPGVTAAYRAYDIFLGPWMDFVYRIGSDQPRGVSYRVECHVEDHVGDRIAERKYPNGYILSGYIGFDDLREWSMGKVALRPGIYSLWLSRDIRICMLDALDLILAEDDFGRRPLANGLVNEGPPPLERSGQMPPEGKMDLPSPSRTPVGIAHEFGAVKLDADGRTAYVWGEAKHLTFSQFKVIAALIAEGARGIYSDPLAKKTGTPSARSRLADLRKQPDGLWRAAILNPPGPWRINPATVRPETSA